MRFLGDDWFARPLNQAVALAYANTARGRRRLAIHDAVPTDRSVVAISPNSVTWLATQRLPTMVGALLLVNAAQRRGGPLPVVSDFRCNARFAFGIERVIHNDGLEGDILAAAARWRTRGLRFPGLTPRFAWADTDTSYPDPNPESTSVDGLASHGADGTWTSIVNGAGDFGSDSGSNWSATLIQSASGANVWSNNRRAIVLFDTSGMGTGASVASSVFSFVPYAQADPQGWAPTFRLVSSAPASNTAVVAGDYDSVTGTQHGTADLTYAGLTLDAYNAITLNATGEAAIDVEGVTKLGMREATYDIADTAPTWAASKLLYVHVRAADTSGTATDPKLVTEYTPGAPVGLGVAAMLLLGAA